MIVIITVFATLAAVLHIVFFYLESIAWRRPTVWKLFQVRSQEDAETTRTLAYNQGFYNLFLAVGVLLGTLLYGVGNTEVGFALAVFSLSAMLAASVVLISSGKAYIKAAIIQGLLPLVTLVLYLVAIVVPATP